MKKILERVNYFLWRHVGWKLRNLYRSFRNLIRWFPIIWKDRDWDSYHIYEILKTKLLFQADGIGKRDNHTRARDDAGKMRLCVRLIEKIQDDYYDLEPFDYHKSEPILTLCEDKPGYYNWEIKTLSENFDDYFKKYPRIYKIVLKKYPEYSRQRIAVEMGYVNQNRARKLLFKIIEENIERWWD